MEKLTEVELESIKLVDEDARTFERSLLNIEEIDLTISGWDFKVGIQGAKDKPAIITLHDIGLNYVSCYQTFFCYHLMEPVLRNFSIYHITLPGQQENASTLEGTDYPSMHELGNLIIKFCDQMCIKDFIGFGMGAGANILIRCANSHPKRVDQLILINPTVSKVGWVEWWYQRWSIKYLSQNFLSVYSEDYFLWHLFGYKTIADKTDLITAYRQSLHNLNPVNLARLCQTFVNRTDIRLIRKEAGDSSETLSCPVMIVVGNYSSHIDDSVNFNSKLDPLTSTWFKVSDCGGMVQEECPDKLAEAFILMLKGNGYPFIDRKSHITSELKLK